VNKRLRIACCGKENVHAPSIKGGQLKPYNFCPLTENDYPAKKLNSKRFDLDPRIKLLKIHK